MGDEHDSGSRGSGRRAPWERRISDVAPPAGTPSRDSSPPAPAAPPSGSEPSWPPEPIVTPTWTPRPTAAGGSGPTAAGPPDRPTGETNERDATSSGANPSSSYGRGILDRLGITGKDRSPRGDKVSVAQLVDKVAASDSPASDSPAADHPGPDAPSSGSADTDSAHEAPTVVLPAVAAPPPPTAEPISGDRASRAEPEAVGTPQNAEPALTRLALSKVRKRRRALVAGRTLVSLVAVMALAVTGIVWGYLRSTDQGFAQVAALDPESTDVVDAPGQYGDETYLIIGTDTRAGAAGEVGAGTTADADGARSDTIMLINIPADRSRVVAVSFPRDLDVERPECEGWDSSTGDYTGEMYEAASGDKINATYALGGPKCLVKVIQRISGLKISHFVGMDFAGFESMVNEVGGVEVCTPQPLFDYELGTVLANPGNQLIDGRTALNYVRARNIESEGNGDYGRIKRQQLFLSSLLRSALSNRVLFDPGKLNGFVNAFTRDTFVENVKTADLLTLGKSLRNVDAGAVTFLTIPTSGTTYYGNEIPREADIAAIFKAIIDDLPLPGEERSTPTETSTTAPSEPAEPLIAVDPTVASVQVSNASEITGAAATAADSLAVYGFQIVGTGNASSSSRTVVRYSSGQAAEAATVASAIPGAVTEEAFDLGGVLDVVLGSDYAGLITAPTPAGEQVIPTIASGSDVDGDVQLPEDLTVTNAADDTCT